jgi:hypothetical protein
MVMPRMVVASSSLSDGTSHIVCLLCPHWDCVTLHNKAPVCCFG